MSQKSIGRAHSEDASWLGHQRWLILSSGIPWGGDTFFSVLTTLSQSAYTFLALSPEAQDTFFQLKSQCCIFAFKQIQSQIELLDIFIVMPTTVLPFTRLAFNTRRRKVTMHHTTSLLFLIK